MKPRLAILPLVLLFMEVGSTVHATSYYSDPVGGSMGNDGSTNSPWGNLKAIFAAGKTFVAGDEILLMDGAHGKSYTAGNHTDYVTIKSLPGHDPRVAGIQLGPGSHWAFEGLTFTSDGSGGTFTNGYMLLTHTNLTYLKVENCVFHSGESSATWTKADWYANAFDAVRIGGDYTVFNGNLIKNTYFALQIEGDHAEVKNNLIDNFGADALRALGSHAVYENNTIRDAYIQDYAVNHDDAIQMYDKDDIDFGMIDDVVFRNNTIYSFADPITQSMIDDDLVGYFMQSIILTDGHAENMVVENNLIVADHAHGITLSGPINCRVQNNTVMKTPTPVNPASEADSTPWIAFWTGKQGHEPTNSIMRNNMASAFTPDTHSNGVGIVVENNLEPATNEYSDVFSDYTGFDLSLKTNSPAIDIGVNTDLAPTDIDGHPRLVGVNVDCGAYEFQLLSPYEVWIAAYPGVGTATNMTDNPDHDSLNNLYEWGLGGNPDDGGDIGHVPTHGIVDYLGGDGLEYIYARRNDFAALGLVYHLEQNTNLVDGVWINANYDFLAGDPDSAGPGFGAVTNWVETTVDNSQFLRLIIEAN